METPFTFGRIAAGLDFTDRENENQRLVSNFLSGTNTILISPRRWGKSSLVKRAATQAARSNSNVRFCFFDMYNVRSEEQFYQSFAHEVLKAASGKWEEMVRNTRTFLGHLVPKLTLSPEPSSEVTLALDWEEVKKNPDEILDMAEKIARSKKQKWVICIDEFQNLSEWNDSVDIQKKLRSHFQKHQHVTYCIYGSKRHMMMNVFSNPSMPFYKFGDLIFLEKISEQNWVKFLCKRFEDTGKKLNSENALLIAQLAECHPYYVQQLAQQTWLRSGRLVSEQIIRTSLESLVLQLSLLFSENTDGLSAPQVNFLHALLMGVKELSSGENVRKYNLGTSANVLRIKQALTSKEIIDIRNSEINFLDPMYKHWLNDFYFRIPGKGIQKK